MTVRELSKIAHETFALLVLCVHKYHIWVGDMDVMDMDSASLRVSDWFWISLRHTEDAHSSHTLVSHRRCTQQSHTRLWLSVQV